MTFPEISTWAPFWPSTYCTKCLYMSEHFRSIKQRFWWPRCKQGQPALARRPHHLNARPNNYNTLLPVGVAWTRSILSFNNSNSGACEWWTRRTEVHSSSGSSSYSSNTNINDRCANRNSPTTPRSTPYYVLLYVPRRATHAAALVTPLDAIISGKQKC